MQTKSTTYTKLRNGEWGIRTTSKPAARGAYVLVQRKDGTSKGEHIEDILWQGDGVYLCSIRKEQRQERHTGSHESHGSSLSKFCRTPRACAEALSWDAPDRLCNSCATMFDRLEY